MRIRRQLRGTWRTLERWYFSWKKERVGDYCEMGRSGTIWASLRGVFFLDCGAAFTAGRCRPLALPDVRAFDSGILERAQRIANADEYQSEREKGNDDQRTAVSEVFFCPIEPTRPFVDGFAVSEYEHAYAYAHECVNPLENDHVSILRIMRGSIRGK